MEKLIRSKIPEIALQSKGDILKIRVASQEEFLLMLRHKLIEESTEVLNSTSRESLIDEVADVLEVLKELVIANDIEDEVFQARSDKYLKYGGFDKKIILML